MLPALGTRVHGCHIHLGLLHASVHLHAQPLLAKSFALQPAISRASRADSMRGGERAAPGCRCHAVAQRRRNSLHSAECKVFLARPWPDDSLVLVVAAHSSVGFGVSHSHNEQRMQDAAAAVSSPLTTGTSSCRFALDRCSMRLRGVMENRSRLSANSSQRVHTREQHCGLRPSSRATTSERNHTDERTCPRPLPRRGRPRLMGSDCCGRCCCISRRPNAECNSVQRVGKEQHIAAAMEVAAASHAAWSSTGSKQARLQRSSISSQS